MRLPLISLALCTLAVSACTDNNAGDGGDAIGVVSTDDECRIDAASAEAGTVVFDVKNEGSQATEFYLLGADGVAIIGEVENVGPGVTRQLVVVADPGEYITACKPGMVGDGIRASFTVTGDATAVTAAGTDDETAALLDDATSGWADYVQTETAALVTATATFADLYTTGDDDAARKLYPEARMHWERIEPVAESFGDLDPRLDLREADLAAGEEWTGWHRIEKDLWPPAEGYTPATDAERVELADLLVADTDELAARVDELSYTPDQLGNGAKELLDEVATGKVTGEEEIWSHTDLWDFQANLEGARTAFDLLRPALERNDPELASTIAEHFDEVQTMLDEYRDGDGFVSYDTLTAEQVRELSDAVNGLAEPLSHLTAGVLL